MEAAKILVQNGFLDRYSTGISFQVVYMEGTPPYSNRLKIKLRENPQIWRVTSNNSKIQMNVCCPNISEGALSNRKYKFEIMSGSLKNQIFTVAFSPLVHVFPLIYLPWMLLYMYYNQKEKCLVAIQEGNWNIQISEVYRISDNICEKFWNLDIPQGVNLLKY